MYTYTPIYLCIYTTYTKNNKLNDSMCVYLYVEYKYAYIYVYINIYIYIFMYTRYMVTYYVPCICTQLVD